VFYKIACKLNKLICGKIGMGFGGLTIALAQLFPDKLVLGMEIRAKVILYSI
jgi:tRNA (guanine-N7-)-methyltransferase